MNHFPRNGQYELFIVDKWIYCFDDLDHVKWPNIGKMISWLDRQNPVKCRVYRVLGQGKPSAYYLDPSIYFLWKLAWSEYETDLQV